MSGRVLSFLPEVACAKQCLLGKGLCLRLHRRLVQLITGEWGHLPAASCLLDAELAQRTWAVRLLGHPGFPGAKFSPRECTELGGRVSPGKHFDNNAERLGDRGKKKRAVCLGTDLGPHVQGLSNSSSSEWHSYLGKYEKSNNNVLFTAFIIGLLGSQCSQPPNHKQGCALPSGSQGECAAGSWDPGPSVPGGLHHQAWCQPRGPWKPRMSPPPPVTVVRVAPLHTAWTRKQPGMAVLTAPCLAQQAGRRKDET